MPTQNPIWVYEETLGANKVFTIPTILPLANSNQDICPVEVYYIDQSNVLKGMDWSNMSTTLSPSTVVALFTFNLSYPTKEIVARWNGFNFTGAGFGSHEGIYKFNGMACTTNT